MKNKIWRIIKLTLSIFLFVTLVVLAFSIVFSAIKHKPLPTVFGFGACVVVSESMEPTLSVNDVIFFKETQNADVGDMVLYKNNGSLVVHRVFHKEDNNDVIITKGDANKAADLPIKSSDIIGKVVGHIPGIGFLINFLKSIYGIITIILLGFVVCICIYIIKNLKSKEKI